MKVALDVKSNSRLLKPKQDDIIIFDGKSWYITTKAAIFQEYEEKMDAKIAELEQLVQEMEQFRREISAQMVTMSEIIERFVKLQGE